MRNQINPIALGLATVFSVFFLGSSVCAESWTDLSGTKTVEAEMIGLWNDTVVLQMLDGRRISIPMSKLQAGSRIQAQNLARAKQQTQASIVQELQGQAKEASAPAPNPLPQPSAADAYVMPRKGASCAQQAQWLEDQSHAGHILLAQFDAMPAAMQIEAGDSMKSSLTTAGPQTISAIHKVGDLIVTRQKWLFRYPRIDALDETSFGKLTEFLLGAGGAVRDGLDPKVMNLDKMATMPTRAWVATIDATIAPHLAKIYGLRQKAQITVGEEKNGVAVVTKDYGAGETSEEVFELIDGMWVPQGLNEQFPIDKQQLTGLAVAASTVVAISQPLVDARTEQDFHASLESLFLAGGPIIEQLALSTGSTTGRRGDRRNGSIARSGSNMGDEESFDMDEMDMEEEMMMGSGEDGGMSEAEMERQMEEEMSRGMSGAQNAAKDAARRAQEAAIRGAN